jgi:hypothetical protein
LRFTACFLEVSGRYKFGVLLLADIAETVTEMTGADLMGRNVMGYGSFLGLSLMISLSTLIGAFVAYKLRDA